MILIKLLSKKILNMIKYFSLAICVILVSGNTKPNQESIAQWKQEVMDTEKAFAKMVQEEGLHKAFVSYAAEDAVLKRNNKLIIGRKNIDTRYENQSSKTLSWEPDFVDVSNSGDMAYTYGQYTYSSIDSSGLVVEDKGVFHTVWKRQADDTWKYVWD